MDKKYVSSQGERYYGKGPEQEKARAHETLGKRKVEMLNKENKHNLSDFTEFVRNGQTSTNDWLQTNKHEGHTMYLPGNSDYQKPRAHNTELISINDIALHTSTKKLTVNEYVGLKPLGKNGSEKVLKRADDARAYSSVTGDNRISEETVMKVRSYLNSKREVAVGSEKKTTPSKSVDSKVKGKRLTSVTAAKRPSKISDGVIDVALCYNP